MIKVNLQLFGGRGQTADSGSSNSDVVKEDNSQVILSNRTLTATENVVKALGEENVRNISDYVNGHIEAVTGIKDYVALNMIDGAKGDAYAWMNYEGTMGINTGLFKKDIKDIKESYEYDVKLGYHPKNTTFNDIAVHEAGHYLDNKLTKALHKNGTLNTVYRASTEIVRTALQNLNKAGDKRSFEKMQHDLSGYGAEYYNKYSINNFSETFAEAVADYGRNKGNANTLSKEIVKITREYLKKAK